MVLLQFAPTEDLNPGVPGAAVYKGETGTGGGCIRSQERYCRRKASNAFPSPIFLEWYNARMTRLPSSSWHPIWQLNRGRRPRTRGVVIHVMAGTLPGTLTWWSRRGNTVGAHVCVSNTRVVQTADLDALCNHAAGENTHDGGLQWGNTEFVGIEHEGTGRETALGWLRRRKMLQMSAKRTAWILYHYKCGKPVWGENVVRHSAFSGTSHACPGAGFPRRIYMIWVRRAYRKLKNTNGRRWA